jgi:hypothetical protein
MNDPDRRHPWDGIDDDAIFANIVAHLNDEATEAERSRWPSDEDVTTDDESTDQPPIDPPLVLPTPGDPQAVTPPPEVWRAHEVDEEPQDHFTPPPVTPLPVGDLQFWAIIAGMAGGPLLLLYLAFFNRTANGYWVLAAIAMSIGGFALLVSRRPGHHDDDDGSRL